MSTGQFGEFRDVTWCVLLPTKVRNLKYRGLLRCKKTGQKLVPSV